MFSLATEGHRANSVVPRHGGSSWWCRQAMLSSFRLLARGLHRPIEACAPAVHHAAIHPQPRLHVCPFLLLPCGCAPCSVDGKCTLGFMPPLETAGWTGQDRTGQDRLATHAARIAKERCLLGEIYKINIKNKLNNCNPQITSPVISNSPKNLTWGDEAKARSRDPEARQEKPPPRKNQATHIGMHRALSV